MENQDGGWKKAIYILTFVFVLCFAYAIVRYNVVRDVSIEHIPVYIANKAIALASVIIIGLSFLLGPMARFFPNTFVSKLYLRKPLGIVGFGVAALHALMAMAIYSPAYYGRSYLPDGKLTLTAESAMLFGILAFMVFAIVAISSLPSVAERMTKENWQTIQRLGYLAYFFTLLHVAVMGYKGWLDPASYQYGLISITLVSVLFIILVFIMRILTVLFTKKP